ncbi:glycosyltransferase [Alteromonas stellipolaris]|uniref:glycosyltransferase n=1 Tax=Alteromonas stellipolaris TaxID=233316 RepID=UPI0026E3561F|nr:glycosyltransferase [Alteromonas stellipolaris]MDO6540066.1 glycosyltransferase [Alteromonas stellipolaris]
MKDAIARLHRNKKVARPLDTKTVVYDTVFVVNANSKGWILDKICKIIMEASDKNCYILYTERNDQLTFTPPPAHEYFFSHYSVAFWSLIKYPELSSSRVGVWFTHFDNGKGISVKDLSAFFNTCYKIFTPNSRDKSALEAIGVDKEKLRVILGGADNNFFRPHKRGKGKVGIVGAYYPRKQPSKLYDVVASMPNTHFLLVAPGPNDVSNPGILWRNWTGFNALKRLENFTYIESAYEHFPDYYDKMDIYLSLSELEGGPIPIIEAMMSNAIPVATDTGFARDIMVGETSKYILDVDAPVSEIVELINEAKRNTKLNVRALSEHLGWDNFGRKINEEMNLVYTVGEKIDFSEGGNGVFYLREGWFSPELRGVKARGETSVINLPEIRQSNGPLLLSLSLWLAGDKLDISKHKQLEVKVGHETIFNSVELSNVPLRLKKIIDGNKLTQPMTIEFILCKDAKDLEGEAINANLKLGEFKLESLDEFKENFPLTFSSSNKENELLSGLWHVAEKSGVWSSGKRASVLLPSSTIQSRVSYKNLIVTGRVLEVSQEESGACSFYVNGTKQEYEVRASTQDPGLKDYILDVSYLKGSSALEIEFETPQLMSPKEVDAKFTDERKLGFYLSKIDLD